VRLSEILIAVPAPADGSAPDDAALAAAKAKADDIEAKLHQGGDFAQLANPSVKPQPLPKAAIWASTGAARSPRCLKIKPLR